MRGGETLSERERDTPASWGLICQLEPIDPLPGRRISAREVHTRSLPLPSRSRQLRCSRHCDGDSRSRDTRPRYLVPLVSIGWHCGQQALPDVRSMHPARAHTHTHTQTHTHTHAVRRGTLAVEDCLLIPLEPNLDARSPLHTLL